MPPSQLRGRRAPRRSPVQNGAGATFFSPSRDSGAVQKLPADPQGRVARYTSLAIAAAASGDNVQAEIYHQHAEHYRKMLHETRD
jgi:Domain of unknown function (DUF4167)